MDRGNPRKRKRREHVVESHIILGKSSQYHLAEDNNRGECSKRVCIAAQQGVLEVRQQLTVDARIGSVQALQSAHPALFDTTTESSDNQAANMDVQKISLRNKCALAWNVV